MTSKHYCGPLWALILVLVVNCPSFAEERFEGRYFSGQGDVEYLQLLDISRRMFSADPEFQNLAMFYTPDGHGFFEGPGWGAWWVQNSYGPTYASLPMLQEPYTTFLQNSQDWWFDQMGDGKRTWTHNGKEFVIPDGQLCDKANLHDFTPKQGDGHVDRHDWGMEFSAAGLVLQSELLLISRDAQAIAHYLPMLERVANFIETRRDPKNNLFLAGMAGNLLAPSYAGWKKPDGTYDKAYLTGLSVTYIAGLDRLIELEKLAGNADKVKRYTERRDLAHQGLSHLMTDEGYFIKSMDPDGTKHGVYGAKKHGYFEAVCNHDAICFRVVDDAQAEKIYEKIASIPGLRPHDLIITNHPSLDDMPVPDTEYSLWNHGNWINGGHWSTCEARMIMGYYRLGKHEDARRAMKKILEFARRFRMDNPFTYFGTQLNIPESPINLCYDAFGPPAAMVRGLFEYQYQADGLTILPHIPAGITRLEQHFPIRFGEKQLYLATTGKGPVTAVFINGQPWEQFDDQSVFLPYEQTPDEAVIQIALGGARMESFQPRKVNPASPLPNVPQLSERALNREPSEVISTNQLPLRIGAGNHSGKGFTGQIGRVRIFNRALTAKEVDELHNATVNFDKDKALVGDWKLDAAQDQVVPNQVGDGLPARIIGQYKMVADSDHPAIELTGEGYLEVAHDSALDLANGGTLDVWIRPKHTSWAHGGMRIIDKSALPGNSGYFLDTFPGDEIQLLTEGGGCRGGSIKPDVWVHVTATINAEGGMVLYANGKEIASKKKKLAPALADMDAKVANIRAFHKRLVSAGLADSYEAAFARLAVDYQATTIERMNLLADGKLARLLPSSQTAADRSYFETTTRLCDGLNSLVQSYEKSGDPKKQQIYRLWSN